MSSKVSLQLGSDVGGGRCLKVQCNACICGQFAQGDVSLGEGVDLREDFVEGQMHDLDQPLALPKEPCS